MRKFPQHGYELWSQVQTFYNGLNYSTRSLVDAAWGVSITRKIVNEAHKLFEELAKNNYQAPSKRSSGRKPDGILEIDKVSSLEDKFEVLITKLNQQPHESLLLGSSLYASSREYDGKSGISC